MAVRQTIRGQARDYIEEIKELIRRKFPDAEFEEHRFKSGEYTLHVYGPFDSTFDVLDLTAERTTDILVDSGIWIHVLPLGRRPDADGSQQ